jgi:hypothetical protein
VPIDRIDVHGVWWRVVPHGGDPLFRPDPPADGRWQRGEVIEAMYFADDEDTAWAEWNRMLLYLQPTQICTAKQSRLGPACGTIMSSCQSWGCWQDTRVGERVSLETVITSATAPGTSLTRCLPSGFVAPHHWPTGQHSSNQTTSREELRHELLYVAVI